MATVSCVHFRPPHGVRAAALLLTAMLQPAHAGSVVELPLHADGFDIGDAGPPPTQTCPMAMDSNGFFPSVSALSTNWMRVPPGYSVANPQPRRLLVALHGCGDTAFNFATWGAVPYPLRESQDYIALSVGGRDNQCWNIATDAPIVAAAIARARSCFFVHQRRIVVGGYSSGGTFAYRLAMEDALTYAGVLVENAGLSQAVGAANVDAVLDGAEWRINVAHTARIQDATFPIAGVRSDRDKMILRQFPVVYRELDGSHDGDSLDWSDFLVPAMQSWVAPLPP